MVSGLLKLSEYFPRLKIHSTQEKTLRMLGIDPQKYFGMVVVLSILAATAAFFIGSFFKVQFLIGLWLWVFGISLVFFLIFPKIEMQKRSREIEVAMPFFLRSFGMLLELGIQFQRAVDMAARGSGMLEDEIRIVSAEVQKGTGFQQAFSSFARQFGSLTIKRAISQIILAYETGASGKEIRKIGDELLSIEQHRMKEYSARSAMFGLFFIISSAVLPTFFLVYAMTNRMTAGTDEGLSPWQIKLAMLAIFPAISMAVLLISKATMPQGIFSQSGADQKMLLFVLAFVAGVISFPKFQTVLMIIGSVVGAYIVYKNYKKERVVDNIEENLPDALFAVSGMPKATRIESIFRTIENSGFGALSDEAGKSRRQLEMNVKTSTVLDDLGSRNGSGMLKRTCVMMKEMIEVNSLDKLGILAEDIIRNFQIKRERSQIFALQKYTLIFGAFLIPIILKTAVYLLKNTIEFSGGSLEIVETASEIIPPYLIVYSIIASLAIGDAEGRNSATAIYSIALSAISLATFNFVNI